MQQPFLAIHIYTLGCSGKDHKPVCSSICRNHEQCLVLNFFSIRSHDSLCNLSIYAKVKPAYGFVRCGGRSCCKSCFNNTSSLVSSLFFHPGDNALGEVFALSTHFDFPSSRDGETVEFCFKLFDLLLQVLSFQVIHCLQFSHERISSGICLNCETPGDSCDSSNAFCNALLIEKYKPFSLSSVAEMCSATKLDAVIQPVLLCRILQYLWHRLIGNANYSDRIRIHLPEHRTKRFDFFCRIKRRNK
mmetsp:Transcript_4672/g.9138  ORF Transcript_4672/g.9138 Transcript_4672/m.9138 type:complete len:246 (+) Transcript_4672:323-1060(+)